MSITFLLVMTYSYVFEYSVSCGSIFFECKRVLASSESRESVKGYTGMKRFGGSETRLAGILLAAL